ncbi:formiminotransferase [Nitzschia inconspicua]|uniref:Formiminotransferase n=1 Tax=Nitzschia inconspicua TaxID=303405 RepID=A0A9K3KSQ9_9STRA|nr:formiminotransferase [Nitzschia inconspicua]
MNVACNVYISAGTPHIYGDTLLHLLETTQEHCREIQFNHDHGQIRSNGEHSSNANDRTPTAGAAVAVVHAFCDGPYDRSSFHLAGSPHLVADAVSTLVTRTVECLNDVQQLTATRDHAETEAAFTPHPTVGLIDHVSVLPLQNDNVEDGSYQEVTGEVAKTIGATMQGMGIDVFYYGYAHPDQISLATVRRDKTSFFSQSDKNRTFLQSRLGQATVGAPSHFTENFNIRLKSNTPKHIAQSLTRHIRERGGMGLPFVEALTLPYSNQRYEVACNLLHPTVISAQDIIDRIQSWEYKDGDYIERSYRVGTTAEMCHKALEMTQTTEGEQQHNQHVMERFQGYLYQPP